LPCSIEDLLTGPEMRRLAELVNAGRRQAAEASQG